MFRHIKKDLTEKNQVHRSSEQQREKKAAIDIQKHIGSLIGADVIERVSINGDALVVKCSSATGAHRARMHTQEIQEKTKTKRVFFLS